MPLERFDSFRTIINEFNTKVGHITQLSPVRGKRPFEHIDDKEEISHSPKDDSFCKVVEGKLPAVLLSKDTIKCEDALSINSTKSDLSDLTAISIVNLFTPMARVLYDNVQQITSIRDKSVGIGLVHLLVNHYDTLSEVPISEIEQLLLTTRLAQKNSISELKSS